MPRGSRPYPAALDTAFRSSGTFANVKGVASLKPDVFTASAFTNHGPWVRGSAVGEQVEGCFIPVHHVRCEEDTSGEIQLFPNAWASWQGTSFAAPKVAGAVAARLVPGVTPALAWKQLTTVIGATAEDPELGVRFENL